MDFRESLAQETSTAVRRASTRRSEQVQRGVEAFRQALSAAIGALEALADDPSGQDADVTGLIQRIDDLATAHAEAAADVVRVDGQRALAVLEGQRADATRKLAQLTAAHGEKQEKLGEAEEKIRALLATLDERRRRQEALVTSMGELQGQVESLQTEIEGLTSRATGAEQELSTARAALEQAENASREAESARRQHEHARKALERELLDARGGLDRSQAESAAFATRLEEETAARTSLEAALVETRSRLESVTAERDDRDRRLEERHGEVARLEKVAREIAGSRRELQVKFEAAVEREATLRTRLAAAEVEASEARALAEVAVRTPADTNPQQASAPDPVSAPVPTAPASPDLDRLIGVYEELESGSTVTGVLTALTKGLSIQFARVALFGVNGNALQGSYQLGFDIDKDITKIVMPLTMESVLTKAFASGRLETETSENPADRIGLPFGGGSGWCLALPVTLNGEALAVIYADQGEQAHVGAELESSHLAFAELLRRHTEPVLTKLTVDLKAWAELRDYATLLLDELEFVYSSDVAAGRPNAELVERLTENLRCAQDSYARRRESVNASDNTSDLFEDRLNAVLDAKGATAFGRHLSVAAAALAASKSVAEPSSAQAAAAQAS
jgi:hypothetical protein